MSTGRCEVVSSVNKLPKPEAEIVSVQSDSDDSFLFEVQKATEEPFNSYMMQCKAQGYTVSANSYDGMYSGDNAEGYGLSLTFHENEKIIEGVLTSAS